MTSNRAISMRETADLVDMSWERFRKRWPTLRRELRFPAPFKCSPYAWREEAVLAWRLARERALGGTEACPAEPANDHADRRRPPASPKLDRERAELARLMAANG